MPFTFEKGKLFKGFGKRFRRGRKRGHLTTCRQSTKCICPNCRFSTPSQNQIPCFKTKCPDCGNPMVRLFLQD